jgi:predicted outer membrane protein
MPPSITSAPAAGPVSLTPTLSDAQIAGVMAVVAAGEVAMDTLAATRAKNQVAKSFVGAAVEDDQKDRDEAIGVGVAPESSPLADQVTSNAVRARDRLAGLGDTGFERAFLDEEVATQQWIVDMIDHALLPNAASDEVRGGLATMRARAFAKLQYAETARAAVP